MQQIPYTYRAKKARRPYLIGFFTFLLVPLLALATGLIQLHTYAVYQTYQQGSCTIISGTTDYNHPTKESVSYYTPDLTYIVHTKDGQEVEAEGYDAPDNQEYSTQQDAQQVVDSYTVGQAYNCWYNPANPTHAVLVYYGYNTSNLIVDYVITVLISIMGYAFLWYLLYYTFYRQLCLMRRGVLTRGRAESHIERRTRSGRKTYTRIFFSPVDDPSQSFHFTTSIEYPIGSWQRVCYDPKNPKNVQHGNRPGSGCATVALTGFIVGVLITGLILLNVWNGI